MQLKCGYLIAVGLVVIIVVFGWKQGKFSGDGSNTRIGSGSRVRIQQRFSEQRNFIRYTANRGRLNLPSAPGTAELCRRFGVSKAALLNANGQRNSAVLQPDSMGQIRIPL